MRSIIQLKLRHIKECYRINEQLNKAIGKSVIRNDNFPCEVSENLVMYVLNDLKLYNKPVVWNKLLDKPGDLSSGDKLIEVKSCNYGPTSYGPTEKWDEIYFLDTSDFLRDIYILYRVKLANDSPEWKNIKFSKTETFHEQTVRKIRPRQSFLDTIKQIHPMHVDTYMFSVVDDSKISILIS
jgi:hypothetical protein